MIRRCILNTNLDLRDRPRVNVFLGAIPLFRPYRDRRMSHVARVEKAIEKCSPTEILWRSILTVSMVSGRSRIRFLSPHIRREALPKDVLELCDRYNAITNRMVGMVQVPFGRK